MKTYIVSLTVLLLSIGAGPILAQGQIEYESLPSLNQAVSNNAVAGVSTPHGIYLYSFLGLGKAKTWRDVSSRAAVLAPGSSQWTELEHVPGSAGRLAATAIAVGGAAWVFGGYTVAEDGSEKSTSGIFRIRPGESKFEKAGEMPVPVEDSVVLAYEDRYVYLVSGWHDLGNVNLVQVLDTQTMKWTQATPWPGAPVFGHSGGISGGRMLICDGIRIQYPADDSPRRFLSSAECWLGRIDSEDHRRIHWKSVPAHPGVARYRMAAAPGEDKPAGISSADHERVVFSGGSGNPYNFDGIGYNGVPSDAESSVFSYHLASGEWQCHGHLPSVSMDHRGLPEADGWYFLIGGMREGQIPVADVIRFRITGTVPCTD
jgi:hypothetical protein